MKSCATASSPPWRIWTWSIPGQTCQVGPMIEEDSRASTLEALERSGGTILTGGKPLDRDGFYLEPTLVEVDNPTNPLTQEEILAPIAALLEAGSAA